MNTNDLVMTTREEGIEIARNDDWDYSFIEVWIRRNKQFRHLVWQMIWFGKQYGILKTEVSVTLKKVSIQY